MKYIVSSTPRQIDIAIQGKLTYTDYHHFNQITNQIGQYPMQNCVINLGQLEFIDSAGLGMLLVARDKVLYHKGQITLHAPHGQVLKMLELSKFNTIFNVELN